MLKNLNFPEYHFKYKKIEGKLFIWDQIRKQYVHSGPEEVVRQNLVEYFMQELDYPKSLINVEKQVKVNGMSRRTDVMVFNKEVKPLLIAECKAPNVAIDQSVFDQIANYNLALKVNYLVITNGLKHFCCKLDHKKGQYCFVNRIPLYSKLDSQIWNDYGE